MKKALMLVSALAFLAFSCTKPDNPSGEDTGKQPEENTGGNENNGNTEDPTPAPTTYQAGDFYKIGITEGVEIGRAHV